MKRQRPDDNQDDLVKVYERLGCKVQRVSAFLSCDLIVGGWGVIDWVEIKDGSKPPSARKLSAKEIEFQAKWESARPVVNVKNVEEVMEHVYRMRGFSTGVNQRYALDNIS